MINNFVRQLCFGKPILLFLICATTTMFSVGCTLDQAKGTAATLANDIVSQLIAWLLL